MSGAENFQCRQVLVKAVVGKGHKFSQATHTIIPSHTPSTILGCWVINNRFQAEKVGDAVEINGTYDCNLWYSFADNTQTEVKKETVSYREIVPLTFLDRNARGELEIIAHAVEQPKCVKAEISGGAVSVRVDKSFAVEVVGETKMCVVVCEGGCDDKDYVFGDDYEDSSDDLDFDSASLLDDLD